MKETTKYNIPATAFLCCCFFYHIHPLVISELCHMVGKKKKRKKLELGDLNPTIYMQSLRKISPYPWGILWGGGHTIMRYCCSYLVIQFLYKQTALVVNQQLCHKFCSELFLTEFAVTTGRQRGPVWWPRD